jgi:filamentous hemagglutinin family protein
MGNVKSELKSWIAAPALLCALAALPAHAQLKPSAPVLTQPTAPAPSSTFTINGSGFGVKSVAAPVKFDDFESAADNAVATSVGYQAVDPYPGTSILPRVTTLRAHNGSKAMRQIYPIVRSGEGTFPKVGISGLNSTELYVALWGYWERTSGSGYWGVFKLVRGGAFPTYSGTPRFYETVFSNNSTGKIDQQDVGFNTPGSGTTYAPWVLSGDYSRAGPKQFDANGWHFLEYYYKLSSPGQANGAFQTWVDGKLNVNLVNAVTRDSGSSAVIDYTMTLFDGMDGNTSAAFDVFMDEFYVDKTRARVVMTDNSSYASSTKFALQRVTSWNDTQIAGSVNKSGFTSGSTAYLHVFNASGTEVGTPQAITLQ